MIARRLPRAVVLTLAFGLGVVPAAAVAAAPGGVPVMPTTAPVVHAKAWILVDVDTGRVIDELDAHARRRPASVIKLLTVITARRLLAPNARVSVSDLAASMPAHKLGLKSGQRWPMIELVHAAVVVSANDAAVALAERVGGGSLDGFTVEMQRTARRLGLVDSPQLDDPTGLDDGLAHAGGDWISAWDLAIVARAALADPLIARLAATPIVRFTDASGTPHRLVNHNRLLNHYAGANGLKTGYTSAAGHTLMASATRDGRTMVVVVLGADTPYAPTIALLDRGFATPVDAESGPSLGPPPPATVRTAKETPDERAADDVAHRRVVRASAALSASGVAGPSAVADVATTVRPAAAVPTTTWTIVEVMLILAASVWLAVRWRGKPRRVLGAPDHPIGG